MSEDHYAELEQARAEEIAEEEYYRDIEEQHNHTTSQCTNTCPVWRNENR